MAWKWTAEEIAQMEPHDRNSHVEVVMCVMVARLNVCHHYRDYLALMRSSNYRVCSMLGFESRDSYMGEYRYPGE